MALRCGWALALFLLALSVTAEIDRPPAPGRHAAGLRVARAMAFEEDDDDDAEGGDGDAGAEKASADAEAEKEAEDTKKGSGAETSIQKSSTSSSSLGAPQTAVGVVVLLLVVAYYVYTKFFKETPLKMPVLPNAPAVLWTDNLLESGTMMADTPTSYAVVTPTTGDMERKPYPTLLIFTGTMETTLGCNETGVVNKCYYANACPFLVRDYGWACVSMDLPGHGSQCLSDQGEPCGLTGWRWRTDNNMNFVDENNKRAFDVLNSLIALGIADPERLAVSGISRGGFAAAQYTAFDSRIKATAMLAPVTDLRKLTKEFGGEAKGGMVGTTEDTSALTASLDLNQDKYLSILSQRNVYGTMGAYDGRVSTDSFVTLFRNMQNYGCSPDASGFSGGDCPTKTSEIEFHVMADPAALGPDGHQVPRGADGQYETNLAVAKFIQRHANPKDTDNDWMEELSDDNRPAGWTHSDDSDDV